MRHRIRILAAFLLCLALRYDTLNAQCPVTADAGPDKFVCAAGNAVQLDGSISGSYIGSRWAPATGLSNASILNPVATVNNTVTYTLTAAAVDPAAPNLVNNPGFESGNSGFTSGYAFNPLPVTPGTYVLTTSPALVLSAFPPCDDHTFGNGTGYMMLCNGNGGASTQVWCQTIPVTANSWYTLSAWALCSPISPPVFQMKVNGVNAGTSFAAQGLGCVWQEFTATWFSGPATSANFCIFDISGSGNGLFGDDFALDDIFMAKACTATDQVTVSVVQVNAVLPATVVLPCSAAETGIVLNGSGSSSGPGYTYSWDGPGILSGGNTLTPTVNETGTYTLSVSFDTGDGVCTKTAVITVLPDPQTVVANAVATAPLTCANNAVTISGVGSSVGGLVSYDWQPAAGIVSGNGTLFPVVNQPGQYTLLVTHNVSGCTATATAVVNQNVTPPVATAAAPGTLPCIAGTLTLSGAGSTTGNNIAYLWIGPGIVSGGATLNNCVVNAPGPYTLKVTNNVNGCTATATVNVVQSGTPPVVMVAANAPGALNCVTQALTLNSAGSSNDSTFTFLWSTANGHFTGPVNGKTAMVDSAGSYILTITNPQNGCTATDTVAVVADTIRPLVMAAANAPGVLNCVTQALTLNSMGSSNGSMFVFLWSTANGHFTGPVNGQTAAVDSAGSYILTITNPQNGCTATDTVSILQHDGVSILPDSQTDPACFGAGNGSIEVLATGGDSTYTYAWDNGADMPAINNLTAGTYTLTVTDGENCSATASFMLSQPAELLAQAVATPTSAAGADDGTAAANPVGGTGPYTFLWNPGGAVTPQITGLTIGFYTVTVTDAHACTAVQTVEVLGGDCTVSAVVSVVQPSCAGLADGQASVTPSGGALPYSYSWNSGGTGSLETGLTVGTYTVTVTDANGCTDTGVAILEAMDVELPVIQVVATTVYVGPSGSVTLTLANLGATATDNCSLASVQIVPDEFDCTDLGVRQVTLTASDVSGNSSSVTIPVTIVDNIPPALECPPNETRCFDDRVVNYIAPVAIENCLSLGGQFAQVEGLPGGSEFPVGITVNTYTFTDAQGNTGSCSFEVVIRPPFSVVQDSIIQDTDNQHSGAVLVTVSGSQPGYTYLWTLNGQPVANTEDLSGAGMGEYMLSVTDSAGCTAQAGPFVVSNLSAADNPDWTGGVGVFPNPTSGKLFLQFPPESASMEMDVAVYDATGRRVLEQYFAGQSRVELDLNGFADGFYALSIRAAGRWGMWKIAVMR